MISQIVLIVLVHEIDNVVILSEKGIDFNGKGSIF